MELNEKLYRILSRSLLALAPVALVLRILVYWKEIQIDSAFFRDDGLICSIFNGICFAVFFACLVASFLKAKPAGSAEERTLPDLTVEEDEENGEAEEDEEDEEDGELPPLLFSEQTEQDSPLLVEEDPVPAPAPVRIIKRHSEADELSGFAARIATWHGTLSAFASLLPGFGFLAYTLSFFGSKEQINTPFHRVLIFLSILCGLYFLWTAFFASAEKSAFRAFAALVPSLWCCVRMVLEYRSLARFVNKPLYIGQFLFLLSCLIFFLYQAQILLGERAMLRPNSFVFPALPVVFFGLTVRLPQLVAVLGDRITMDLVDAAAMLIDLALTLYVALKIRAAVQKK